MTTRLPLQDHHLLVFIPHTCKNSHSRRHIVIADPNKSTNSSSSSYEKERKCMLKEAYLTPFVPQPNNQPASQSDTHSPNPALIGAFLFMEMLSLWPLWVSFNWFTLSDRSGLWDTCHLDGKQIYSRLSVLLWWPLCCGRKVGHLVWIVVGRVLFS